MKIKWCRHCWKPFRTNSLKVIYCDVCKPKIREENLKKANMYKKYPEGPYYYTPHECIRRLVRAMLYNCKGPQDEDCTTCIFENVCPMKRNKHLLTSI